MATGHDRRLLLVAVVRSSHRFFVELALLPFLAKIVCKSGMYSQTGSSMAVVVVVIKESILFNYGPTYMILIGRPHIGCQVFDGAIMVRCLCQDLSRGRESERGARSQAESRGKIKLRLMATCKGLATFCLHQDLLALRPRPGRFFASS